jgi:hypothetical protein
MIVRLWYEKFECQYSILVVVAMRFARLYENAM